MILAIFYRIEENKINLFFLFENCKVKSRICAIKGTYSYLQIGEDNK